MLTVGVDLAARPARTALAVIDWDDGKAVITTLVRGADDDVILAALAQADKAGIDCPLGWPDAFLAFLCEHQAGRVAVPDGLTGLQWRRQLAWRRTDEVVRARTGLIPLSVAADRIGHAAMRCAGLLAQLADQGRPVDRTGTGVVVEVYPAASLKQWHLPHRGYKAPRNAAELAALTDALLAAARWLEATEVFALCKTSHDALNAVVAALTARAAALGMTIRPNDEQAAAARSEGWIALPGTPLSMLA